MQRALPWLLCTVCALTLIAGRFVHAHATFAFAEVPGFYALVAAGGGLALIIAARLLRRLTMRSEDYYDDDRR